MLEKEREQCFIAVESTPHFSKGGRAHGWAPKRPFRDGDATSENTQPSQNGGRRDGERGEFIEGEGKD